MKLLIAIPFSDFFSNAYLNIIYPDSLELLRAGKHKLDVQYRGKRCFACTGTNETEEEYENCRVLKYLHCKNVTRNKMSRICKTKTLKTEWQSKT